ncbi:hypothetical protein ACX93W_23050 [Paenibacillus sp. CAU 1782]
MKTNMGRLVVYVGAAGSRENKKLTDLYERLISVGNQLAVFQPFEEGKSLEFVEAEDGRRVPAIAIDYLDEILFMEEAQCLQAILVKDIHFFDKESNGFKVLEELMGRGTEVYVFGLNREPETNMYGLMGDIIVNADEIHQLHTFSVANSREARSIKPLAKSSTGGGNRPGKLGAYTSYCRSYFNIWRKRLKQLQNTVQITVVKRGSDR